MDGIVCLGCGAFADARVSVSTIGITGATGFIGSALLTALQGRSVRRALRRPAVDTLSGDAIVGDVSPDTDWVNALAGVNCVVHLAARTHVMTECEADPLTAYRRINVDATRNLAQQAAAAGVRRFVFLSSIKVNGEATRENPFSENDVPQPLDAYGLTKHEAEMVLRQIGEETSMEIVVLRPPLVYGPGVKGNFRRLLQWVDHGIPLPLASVKNQRSLIYVENLASAIVACVDTPAAAGKTFLVSDDAPVSTPELIARVAAAMGKPARLFPCPVSALTCSAALLGKAGAAMRLTGSLVIDSTRIREELGWRPRYTLDQGLIATVQWYHQGQN